MISGSVVLCSGDDDEEEEEAEVQLAATDVLAFLLVPASSSPGASEWIVVVVVTVLTGWLDAASARLTPANALLAAFTVTVCTAYWVYVACEVTVLYTVLV